MADLHVNLTNMSVALVGLCIAVSSVAIVTSMSFDSI